MQRSDDTKTVESNPPLPPPPVPAKPPAQRAEEYRQASGEQQATQAVNDQQLDTIIELDRQRAGERRSATLGEFAGYFAGGVALAIVLSFIIPKGGGR